MKRRSFIGTLGMSAVLPVSGCTSIGRDTFSDSSGADKSTDNSDDVQYADRIPDEATFDVEISAGSNDHLEIQSEVPDHSIKHSGGDVIVTLQNQADSEIRPVADYGFFAPEQLLRRGEGIDQLYMWMEDTPTGNRPLSPGENESAKYTVEFAHSMLGGTFTTNTTIPYNWRGNILEFSYSIAVSASVTDQDQ
ncbi:hypothetical protein [Natronobiforma cellulositropha]|uniref:hypothetical protein n=1 Tax=Natronobiforma cellulositropha TaxID=1679076 RepID=UPI0021D593FD|nr:hypothetical protein [Natronobiforma cellulositropha]